VIFLYVSVSFMG